MHSKQFNAPGWGWCLLVLVGCGPDLAASDATWILNQTVRSEREKVQLLEPLTYGTQFTPGVSPEEAAAQIAESWRGQRTCVSIEQDGAELLIDFGPLTDACLYQGRRYGGEARVVVQATYPDTMKVWHEWIGLQTEALTLDGDATVQWSQDQPERRVHSFTRWTPADSPHLIEMEADYFFAHRDPSELLVGGLSLEGRRDWSRDGERWEARFRGIERLLYAPAPDDGVYEVTDPQGREVEITFAQLDEIQREAIVRGERRAFRYLINNGGVAVLAGRGE